MNIYDFAQQINSAWEEFANWYEFGGGKEKYARDEYIERNAAIMLTETRSVVDLWRQIYSPDQKQDVKNLIEESIRDTAKIEWGYDTRADFDYVNMLVVVSNAERSVEI